MLNIPLGEETLDATYDSRKRLVQLGDYHYDYNAENRRTSSKENRETTRFSINPNSSLDEIIMVTDEEGNPTVYYVYGQGLISKEDNDGAKSYYHYDRRGSTTALTNDNGEVESKYEYDVYGKLISSTGSIENRFMYNGKCGVQTDDSGLYYMRARYYNPDLKRFINRDVVQGSSLDPQTYNRYAHVNGNPVSYLNPFGLSKEADSSLLKGVYDFFIGDDLNALLSPDSTPLERLLAAANLGSNLVSGGQ